MALVRVYMIRAVFCGLCVQYEPEKERLSRMLHLCYVQRQEGKADCKERPKLVSLVSVTLLPFQVLHRHALMFPEILF